MEHEHRVLLYLGFNTRFFTILFECFHVEHKNSCFDFVLVGIFYTSYTDVSHDQYYSFFISATLKQKWQKSNCLPFFFKHTIAIVMQVRQINENVQNDFQSSSFYLHVMSCKSF